MEIAGKALSCGRKECDAKQLGYFLTLVLAGGGGYDGRIGMFPSNVKLEWESRLTVDWCRY